MRSFSIFHLYSQILNIIIKLLNVVINLLNIISNKNKYRFISFFAFLMKFEHNQLVCKNERENIFFQ